jgi:hypothetical protein
MVCCLINASTALDPPSPPLLTGATGPELLMTYTGSSCGVAGAGTRCIEDNEATEWTDPRYDDASPIEVRNEPELLIEDDGELNPYAPGETRDGGLLLREVCIGATGLFGDGNATELVSSHLPIDCIDSTQVTYLRELVKYVNILFIRKMQRVSDIGQEQQLVSV